MSMGLVEWLREREENALLFAQERDGHDKAGWIEDAEYLRAAILALQRQTKLLEALHTIANYPRQRSDELGYRRCMQIAQEALMPNIQGERRAAVGASFSGAELGGKTKEK